MEYATGFDYVFVAGEITNKEDRYIEVDAGRILRGEHRLK